MSEQTKRLRELYDKATPGEWEHGDMMWDDGNIAWTVHKGHGTDERFIAYEMDENDAAFVTTAHNSLPDILNAADRAEELQDEVDQLHAELEGVRELAKDLTAKAVQAVKEANAMRADLETEQTANTELHGAWEVQNREIADLRAKLERAVVLPCTIRKTVYVTVKGKVHLYNAVGFETGKNGWDARLESVEGNGVARICWASFSDFGKTVFLTRAEAEAAARGGKPQ